VAFRERCAAQGEKGHARGQRLGGIASPHHYRRVQVRRNSGREQGPQKQLDEEYYFYNNLLTVMICGAES
jgi:hypothetical protein